jgi:integrase
MGRRALQFLSEERGRIYVRRNGRRIRVRELPGTAAFARAYASALDKLERNVKDESVRAPIKGTLGALATRYFGSAEFLALDETSQRNRRRILEHCLRHIHKGTGEPLRNCPLTAVTAAKVKALRDAKADKKGAANNRRKYLSAMFGWAVENGLMDRNPARDVRRFKYATSGFHTWTVSEVAQFEERWPIGTKPRLALALLLFLGVRRGDVVRLAPSMVKGGVITFVPSKMMYKRVEPSEKPILPVLAEIIAKSPIGKATFLETVYNKSFTKAGFGNWFRTQCDLAGLTKCSAHGLRKAGAALAAEKGATVFQLMGIFDWENPAQAQVYTKAADRRRLTADAMPLLGR